MYIIIGLYIYIYVSWKINLNKLDDKVEISFCNTGKVIGLSRGNLFQIGAAVVLKRKICSALNLVTYSLCAHLFHAPASPPTQLSSILR